jgi:Na+/melibiose symporter-like transporter
VETTLRAVPGPGRTPPSRLDLVATAAYGLYAMPLAMAALPLYVHLPQFYGATLGVDLALLGVILLVLRLADALVDPLLGAWGDRLPSRRVAIALTAPVLALGMLALFRPPPLGPAGLVGWLVAALTVVYAAYSLAMINHGAWGAELSRDPVERTRITAVREALALVGVVGASLAPGLLAGGEGSAAGLARFALLFALVTLACAAVTLRAPSPLPIAIAAAQPLRERLRIPLADPLFRRLVVVFLVNGIASAIPATLVLFFIADVLAAEDRQGMFLALYFVAAALGMPLWVRLSGRWGKVRAWRLGMVASVAAFVWAWGLSAGDTTAYALICVLSGLALGADLALPPSLLADVIDRGGTPRPAGAYFGLWTLATKLNLALAAGVALPLLGAIGYVPGTTDATAIGALALVYAALPCALKLAAIAALGWFAKGTGRTSE